MKFETLEAIVSSSSLRSVVRERRKCILVAVDLGVELHTKQRHDSENLRENWQFNLAQKLKSNKK